MSDKAFRDAWTLMQEMSAREGEMQQYSNGRYEYHRCGARLYLIRDRRLGSWHMAKGDNPIEALYWAVECRESEWERSEGRSKAHIGAIYTCANCGERAWGERERTAYCPGCGASMANPWEGER